MRRDTNLTTRDGLRVYDLDTQASELWAVAGPAGYNVNAIDAKFLPDGFRWVSDAEWAALNGDRDMDDATNVQSVRDIIRAFLDVPKEALPSATYIDQDEPGDPWQDIRDYLTDSSVAPGVEIRLHAARPEWKSVIVSLDPS